MHLCTASHNASVRGLLFGARLESHVQSVRVKHRAGLSLFAGSELCIRFIVSCGILPENRWSFEVFTGQVYTRPEFGYEY